MYYIQYIQLLIYILFEDVQYKRLAATQPRPLTTRPSRGARLAAGLWFLPRSVRQAVPPDAQKISKG